MRLEARAKINWSLDITGVREDGYHLLDMVMQPITLSDTLTLEAADGGAIALQVAGSGIEGIPADGRNLVVRAAEALRRACGVQQGARIRLEKRIPSGAGLGGGSSDAAAVLHGLNRLWGLGLSQERLEAIGLALGADSPFCLRGGLCRVQGIGERLTSLGKGPVWPLVVVQPCMGLSTGAVYGAWHQRAQDMAIDTDALIGCLTAGELARLLISPGNALEPVSRAMQPAIGEAVQALLDAGAVCAQMSGSGSAVYGVFADAKKAQEAVEALRLKWNKTYLCETCGKSMCICDDA